MIAQDTRQWPYGDTLADLTDEQIDKLAGQFAAMPTPGLLERAGEKVKGAVRGAESGIAGALRGANTLGQEINPFAQKENLATQLADVIDAHTPAPDPRMYGEQRLSEFAGGIAPAIGAAILSGGESVPASIMALQMGASAHEDALAGGADPVKAGIAFWAGMGVGGLAAPRVASIMRELDVASGGSITGAIKGLAQKAATGATVMASQRVLSNAIHDYATEDQRSLLEGVAADAEAAGIVDLFLGGAVGTAKALSRARDLARAEKITGGMKDAAASFQAAQDTPGETPHPVDSSAGEPAKPADLPPPVTGTGPIPDPAGPPPDTPPPGPTERRVNAEQLVDIDRGALRSMLIDRLEREDDALRADFPDRGDPWFEQAADKRMDARDPASETREESAKWLREQGVKPLAPDPHATEDLYEALRVKARAMASGQEEASRAGNAGHRDEAREREKARVENQGRENIGGAQQFSPGGAGPGGAESIGGKLSGTLDPTTAATTSKQRVIDKMVNVLRVAGSNSPILQGRVPSWAAGLFDVLPNVVRIQKWGDLYVAAHEIGHALERAVFGYDGPNSPWIGANAQRNGVGARMQGELYRAGKKLYGDKLPNGGYQREGFAEFMRTWLTDPANTLKNFPNFTRWFETAMLDQFPHIRDALTEARDEATVWRTQGSANRMMQNSVNPSSFAARMQDKARVLRYLTSKQAWVSADQAVREMEKTVEKALGRKLEANESVVGALDSMRAMAHGMAANFLHRYAQDFDGERVGPSLDEILAPVRALPKGYSTWFLYLWAKRTEALADWREAVRDEKGDVVPGVARLVPRDAGVSLEDAVHLREKVEAEHPEIALAAQRFYEWQDNVNRYAEGADPLLTAGLRAAREAQEALHPGGFDENYVVLHRYFDDLDQVASRSKSTNAGARLAKMYDAMVGSGRPVKDIMPEMVAQAEKRIELAHRRVGVNRLVNLVRAYPELMNEFAGFDPTSPASLYMNEALERAKQPIAQHGPLAQEDHDLVGSIFTFLANPIESQGGRRIALPVKVGDKVVALEVDPDLYKGMTQLEAFSFKQMGKVGTGLDVLLGFPKRLVVKGAVIYDPAFAMIRNTMMDLPTFVLNTRYYGNPFSALAHWGYYGAYSMIDAASGGRMHKLVGDRFYDAYTRLGLSEMHGSASEARTASIEVHKLFQGPLRRYTSPRNILDYAAQVLSGTEKAARISEAKGALKEAGWDGKAPLTPEMVQAARIGAKQVTLDYSQSGEISRVINQAVPFFNAPIAGVVALGRGAAHHPGRFAVMATGMLGSSIALWNQNKDEDWYKELPLEERARYWYARVKVNGQDALFRWKKPGEIAAFLSITEELIDAGYRSRPVETVELIKSIIGNAGPNVSMPPVLGEAFSAATGLDQRTLNPILPERFAHLEADGHAYEQKGPYTGSLAIWLSETTLGKRLNLSPMKVDHFLRTFFGGVGKSASEGFGLASERGQPGVQNDVAQKAVFGTAFRPGGLFTSNSKSIESFYKDAEIADGRSKQKDAPESFEQGRMHDMVKDALISLSAQAWLRDNQAMNAQERSELTQKMIETARDAHDKFSKGIFDPASFKVQAEVYGLRKKMAELGQGLPPKQLR